MVSSSKTAENVDMTRQYLTFHQGINQQWFYVHQKALNFLGWANFWPMNMFLFWCFSISRLCFIRVGVDIRWDVFFTISIGKSPTITLSGRNWTSDKSLLPLISSKLLSHKSMIPTSRPFFDVYGYWRVIVIYQRTWSIFSFFSRETEWRCVWKLRVVTHGVTKWSKNHGR